MKTEDLPQWLVEMGRRPAVRQTGRPVPPISGSIKHAKEFDEAAAATLERDYMTVIETSTPQDEYELNGRILDAMTANRLSSSQTYRLLVALYRRTDGAVGLSVLRGDGRAELVGDWRAI